MARIRTQSDKGHAWPRASSGVTAIKSASIATIDPQHPPHRPAATPNVRFAALPHNRLRCVVARVRARHAGMASRQRPNAGLTHTTVPQ